MRWTHIWVPRSIQWMVTTAVRNDSFPKKIQTEYGESIISIPRDRNSDFEPVVVPKHQSRGLSIERLVISLYAKGMSVSDIEDELRDIYKINLSTSAISIITKKLPRQHRSGRIAR